MSPAGSSQSKHTEWILETIDHLRKRKARPDLARICHVVRRRFGLSPNDTEAKLEKLVDAEVVIKVDYKGNVSYRNAAKWRKSMLGCGVLNSTAISTKILEAILEICKSRDSKPPLLLSSSSAAAAGMAAPFVQPGIKEEPGSSDTTQAIQNQLDPGSSSSNGNSKSTISNAASPDPETGASLESISAWLKQKCEGFSTLRSPLNVVLKREMDAGRVRRHANGTFALSGPQLAAVAMGVVQPLKTVKKAEPRSTSPTPELSPNAPNMPPLGSPAQPARRGRPPKHRSGLVPSPTLGGNPNAISRNITTTPGMPTSTSTSSLMASTSGSSGFTTGGAIHGSPNSKLKRILTSTSPGGGMPGPQQAKYVRRGGPGEMLCDFCGLTSLGNPRDEPEALLQCKDCTARAHPSCMKYSRLLASRAWRAPWQCMDCKTCVLCQDSGHGDQMLFCDGCDRGFHMGCHQPSVTKKPSGIWECSDCRLENFALARRDFQAGARIAAPLSHDTTPLTPAESPVPANHVPNDVPLSTSPVYHADGKFPDASAWSVEDVVSFLSSAGFSKQAQIFREQEIDGVSLLLLKRSDIITGLDMKLGPALKVNRLVQGLQTARRVGI